ncbi:uncharacterized protein K460DRAFT_366852 [Cucurbitaria berberidis CBS 394.84]|uniref:Uncharacterized protein n=1 Tax=Cucurbitaria berberidis CBS 394.84 TaxID=1168544 RepID=A0A9P4GJ04_9PLEO|nr:uncharacterized protein K460DRAFT_366852 [Cucurbitaria berberidis CBS 394.84]KAF1846010.1 hypothetical protein K460DRAFT_366852 [Cucurbitaria berberidis CBS 394.84]
MCGWGSERKQAAERRRCDLSNPYRNHRLDGICWSIFAFGSAFGGGRMCRVGSASAGLDAQAGQVSSWPRVTAYGGVADGYHVFWMRI